MNININNITAEQIGRKYIEWLQLEREYHKAIKGLYYECQGVEIDDRPRDKTETTELLAKTHSVIRQQNSTYEELKELADLYIAKELI